MRRPLLALALLGAALAVTAQTASTAGSTLPSSTAVHRTTSVSGATVTRMDYTVTAGLITVVTPRLRGTDLLTKSVTAQYGGGTAVLCSAGLLTVLDSLSGLGEATYTCTGFSEPAGRPRALQIRVV